MSALVPLGVTDRGTGRPMYALPEVVAAWRAAGAPQPNSAWRSYAAQKAAWDAWRAGTGAGADNPDDESQPLPHCRGVALDIDYTPARAAALQAAGLIRPFAGREPWHWQLPGDVRRYPIIRTLEDQMTPQQWAWITLAITNISAYLWGGGPDVAKTIGSPDSIFGQVLQIKAQQAAQAAVLAQVAAGKGIDPAALQAAVEDAVQHGLAAGLTGTVTLTPPPSA